MRRRDASAITKRERALIERFMPPPKPPGRPRSTSFRKDVNAILSIATTGCQRAMLANDFPPYSIVQRSLAGWRHSGLLPSIGYALAQETANWRAGRHARPQAIDCRHGKTTESGGIRDYDAGRKTKGRKLHIVLDTIGLLFGRVLQAADVQDLDGAHAVLASIRRCCPRLIRHVFDDGGCAGPKLRSALDRTGAWRIQIVKRSETATGREVVSRRWSSSTPSPGSGGAVR